MATLVFFLFVWLVCKAVKAARNAPAYHPPAIQARPAKKQIDYMSALLALQEQRDIYNDLISDIDAQLDNAPRNREKLLKDKAMIYSKLATVESKIAKLIS